MEQRIKLLSQKEAAEYCDLSLSTLKRLRNIGDFPHPLQISQRRICYFLNEIEDWLNNRPKKKGGDLNINQTKIRCPQTPLEVDQAYDQELAELKARRGLGNGT